MVSAQHRLATEAGAATLSRGGNAMDAAVVSLLVLSVVEPWLSGIGGGGYLLHSDPTTGDIDALDFNVKSSRNLDPDDYPRAPGSDGNWFDWPAVVDDRNLFGYSSICVPGTIAGLSVALERFGTISWEEALAPAIQQAELGLVIDWFACLCIAVDAAGLAKFPASADLFLDEGHAPRNFGSGEAVRHRPMLKKAALLRRLARSGARDFYEGETAQDVLMDLAEGGSCIDANDLADFQPEWFKPATGHYREWAVYAAPGMSGGPTLLAALDKLTDEITPGSAPCAATNLSYARVIRSAYKERLAGMGHAGSSAHPDCTSHVSVVDRDGRMVSATNTLLSRFGSKVTLPRSGFLANNGMMWFDPIPGTPNCIKPGVKPLANMCPLILKTKDQRSLAIGAAGGRQIFPALTQIISRIIDFGMSLEEAFLVPRIDASTPTIKVNRRAPDDIAALIAREFPVEMAQDTLYPVNFAIPSAVYRDQNGLNCGMAHHSHPWANVATEESIDAE
jgi:gamma-glutamyltranspeptidase/glutathione hydrolase